MADGEYHQMYVFSSADKTGLWWEPNKRELNFQCFLLSGATTAQQRAPSHQPRQAESGVRISHQPICVWLFSMVITV